MAVPDDNEPVVHVGEAAATLVLLAGGWISGARRDSPASQAESEETWRSVQQAVLSLPLSHRGVVVLYYVNDLSLQEISEILDIPVGTVKSRLHYGRQTLKRHLGFLTGEPLPELQYEFT
jgi:RNA polymerase sigma factor (sigma-70 family)